LTVFRWAADFFAGFLDDFVAVSAFTAAFSLFVAYLQRRWLRQIIQRIAALLALGPSLDALYQEVAANAFTAEDLGIVR
jgi:hypothetical protein